MRVINVSADPNTRTYMTRIVVPNPTHILRVGMVAEARIQGDRMVDLMTLPAETILRDPQGATIVFVYYPEQGRVYARRVVTGVVYGREVAITRGLSGDEAVVFHITENAGLCISLDRVDDINRMFADPEIEAIFCARGGNGAGGTAALFGKAAQ